MQDFADLFIFVIKDPKELFVVKNPWELLRKDPELLGNPAFLFDGIFFSSNSFGLEKS